MNPSGRPHPHQTRADPIEGPPVFLFGFERSGTTLLAMIVGNHPAIAVPFSVTGLWYRYADRLEAYNRLATAADIARLIGDLRAEERIALWNTQLPEDLAGGFAPSDFASIVAGFHRAYAEAQGKRRWANTDIATLDRMDEANRWFPDAKFVHIVRDGRDVALSHMTMPYGASNVADCAEQWQRRVSTNLKMGAMIGPERYHVIRFEDLILEPATALQGLCTFLGIAYDPAMLDYGAMVERTVPESKRWLWPALSGPLRTDRVGAWRRGLSPVRREVFERSAGDLLRQLGYDMPPPAAGHLSALLLESWYFLDRGDRFRRIGRRLGLKRLSRLERAAGSAKR